MNLGDAMIATMGIVFLASFVVAALVLVPVAIVIGLKRMISEWWS